MYRLSEEEVCGFAPSKITKSGPIVAEASQKSLHVGRGDSGLQRCAIRSGNKAGTAVLDHN